MTDLDEFERYSALADKLYESMTPEQILESVCVRWRFTWPTIGCASAWSRDAIRPSSWERRT